MEQIQKAIKDSAVLRWGVLLLVSYIMAANYFFYDVLSPLQGKLREVLGFTNSEYGFLVSAYSIPNVFLAMAVIGGIILDKIGIRITGIVFVGFMAIGSLLTYYGSTDYFINGGIGFKFFNSFLPSYSASLKMMIFGFFLFGLGAESSIVVITKIVVKWFKGKELALALGSNIAIARMGTALAFLFSASLANSTSWNKAIWIGAGALSLGLLAFILYIIVDLKIDKHDKDKIVLSPEEQFKISDLGKLIKIPALIYITLLCVTFYSAVFPFLKYAPDMMVNKFGFNPEKAGIIAAILPLGTIVFTPLFGLFADYKGRSTSLMILGSLLIILVHLIFVFTNINPYVPMFVLGIGFSLVPAAMWPSVSKIVDHNKLGTAYGFMFSVQNIGLWLFPMLIGFVLDISNPYYKNVINLKGNNQIIENGLNFKSTYLNSQGKPKSNQDFIAKVTIYSDTINKDLIWKESHQLRTDLYGKYEMTLGKSSIIENIDISKINIFNDSFIIELTDTTTKITKYLKIGDIDSSKVSINNYLTNLTGDTVKNGEGVFTIKFVNKNSNQIVWLEDQKIVSDNSGKFEFKIGNGNIQRADISFLNYDKSKCYIEITTPLDYTYSVFMLSLLGILGIIFALLLKREDKRAGLGLELKNISE